MVTEFLSAALLRQNQIGFEFTFYSMIKLKVLSYRNHIKFGEAFGMVGIKYINFMRILQSCQPFDA
jgi:hypothetical protein